MEILTDWLTWPLWWFMEWGSRGGGRFAVALAILFIVVPMILFALGMLLRWVFGNG